MLQGGTWLEVAKKFQKEPLCIDPYRLASEYLRQTVATLTYSSRLGHPLHDRLLPLPCGADGSAVAVAPQQDDADAGTDYELTCRRRRQVGVPRQPASGHS